jgi:hypothetical protein
MAEADYVSDVDALVYLLEANGFKVAWGEFTRRDGRYSRVACQPVDPLKLAEATVRACKWQATENARLIDGSDDD